MNNSCTWDNVESLQTPETVASRVFALRISLFLGCFRLRGVEAKAAKRFGLLSLLKLKMKLISKFNRIHLSIGFAKFKY